MATFSSIMAPASASGGINDNTNVVLAAATSSAEVVVGFRQIMRISNPNASATNIRFGVSGMGAAVATDFSIPAQTAMDFDLGSEFDRIRLFNTPGVSVQIMRLSRAK
jgi:hypothetical protein